MPTITQYEMQRRQAIARAVQRLTDAVADETADNPDGLTTLEWLRALNQVADRMIWAGLAEEWKDADR